MRNFTVLGMALLFLVYQIRCYGIVSHILGKSDNSKSDFCLLMAWMLPIALLTVPAIWGES